MMNEFETERLAELIERKLACLTELCEMGKLQLQLVRGGEMTSLLNVLSAKQRVIERLQGVEKDLTPFRAQTPQSRRWRTELHRRKCAKQIEMCESLLREILEREKQGESELVRRRDEAASQLNGARQAGRTVGAYAETEGRRAAQLDLASEN